MGNGECRAHMEEMNTVNAQLSWSEDEGILRVYGSIR